MAENKLKIPFELFIIGGSAGSLGVLLELLPELVAPLSYAVVIVIHRKNTYDSTLQELLSSRTGIPVKEIEDKDPAEPGTIYIAPADYHLLVEKNKTFSLDTSEKINYSRPSIDVSFESFADAYGPSLCAILLSGANADGTAGMLTIRKAGGTIIAQDPQTAQVPFMPQHAVTHANPHLVLSPAGMRDFMLASNLEE